MKPSYRVWFLIVIACFVFNLSDLRIAVVLVGYYIAERLDQWLDQRMVKKARDKVFDDEIFGWKPSKDVPEYEEKGDFTRVRLTGQNQIIAARIGELLVRMR
jgi:hypothetical protein